MIVWEISLSSLLISGLHYDIYLDVKKDLEDLKSMEFKPF